MFIESFRKEFAVIDEESRHVDFSITYTASEKELQICKRGFHFCENIIYKPALDRCPICQNELNDKNRIWDCVADNCALGNINQMVGAISWESEVQTLKKTVLEFYKINDWSINAISSEVQYVTRIAERSYEAERIEEHDRVMASYRLEDIRTFNKNFKRYSGKEATNDDRALNSGIIGLSYEMGEMMRSTKYDDILGSIDLEFGRD